MIPLHVHMFYNTLQSLQKQQFWTTSTEQIYSVGNGSLTSQQPNEPRQPQLL